jgi:hypothetical protein
MKRDWTLYRDSIHGIEAAAPSKSMAWALIRNECHSRKIEVPTMDKVNEDYWYNQWHLDYELHKQLCI